MQRCLVCLPTSLLKEPPNGAGGREPAQGVPTVDSAQGTDLAGSATGYMIYGSFLQTLSDISEELHSEKAELHSTLCLLLSP